MSNIKNDFEGELTPTSEKEHRNFIENIIAEDLASNKHDGWVVTRFPPEPNGYLHIGHAKSVCLNFMLAKVNPKTKVSLRFDDTNPLKESQEYVDAIQEDIKWLGFEWDELHFSSDYFETLYGFAVELIEKGLAFVDSETMEEISEKRGSFEKPGVNSSFRDRSIEENLDLFKRMRAGEFKDGEHVLRAKIDMGSSYMCMRDPVLYRIRHVHHHRTGDEWCIYPMYDFTHGLSDSIEHVTHSLCTLEFQDNRRLYDWFVENVSSPSSPRQIEFAKLKLNYTIVGKRHLLKMVEEGIVDGWDDPRMPTLRGMRRRGFPPKAIRNFMEMIGVGKQENVIEDEIFFECVRDVLGKEAPRLMGVLNPIKVTLTNLESDIEIEAPLHSQDESFGTRKIIVGKELYIDQDDFMLDPPSPKKWFRLGPERSVRLRYGPIITCEEVIQTEAGEVIELRCRVYPESVGGKKVEELGKVRGIIHWVNAESAYEAKVHLYDRLFKSENPMQYEDFHEDLNPDSHRETTAFLEPYLKTAKAWESYQFERVGYFIVDELRSTGNPVFNQTIGLKSGFHKKK